VTAKTTDITVQNA